MFQEYIEENNIWFLNVAIWRAGLDGKHKVGVGETRLLNSNGEMCCLGQRCAQLGIPPVLLKWVDSPVGISASREFEAPELLELGKLLEQDGLIYQPKAVGSLKRTKNSEFTQHAIGINDDSLMSIPRRISKLRKLLSLYGKTLVVINYYGNEPI